MTSGTKMLAVGFLVGLLAGALVARQAGHRGGRNGMSGEKRQERMLARLSSELKLDGDQRRDIGEILAEGRRRMDEVMAPVRPRVSEVRKETNARIREKLTPDQQKKFDAFSERMEKRRRERRGDSAAPRAASR